MSLSHTWFLLSRTSAARRTCHSQASPQWPIYHVETLSAESPRPWGACQSHCTSWVDDLVASLGWCSHCGRPTRPSCSIHCCLCCCDCCPSSCCRCGPSCSNWGCVHSWSWCRSCCCRFESRHSTFRDRAAAEPSVASGKCCSTAALDERRCSHLAFLAINLACVVRHNLGKQYQEHLREERAK